MTAAKALDFILLVIFSLLLLGLRSAFAQPVSFEMNGAKVVEVGVSSAFVSQGRWDDGNAYAIVNGSFKNGCYAWGSAMVEGPTEDKFIFVKAFATYHSGICIQMIVPFEQKFGLGQLSPGRYTVRFVGATGVPIDEPLTID